MLSLEQVESGYGESIVLRRVDLHVEPGQVVSLMGRNGVGKTTLMKTIMGLLKTQSGRIRFEGQDLTRLPPERRARAGIGYVPQGREIFSQLTVEDNLLLGLEASSRKLRSIPEHIFAMFPVLQEMRHRRGGDLSGGQQQQLAIARALAAEPRLLLLDEPMEGIQPNVVQQIEQVIRSIKDSKKTAVLLVEQSLEFAVGIADYYYVMDRGTMVDHGVPTLASREQVHKHLTV